MSSWLINRSPFLRERKTAITDILPGGHETTVPTEMCEKNICVRQGMNKDIADNSGQVVNYGRAR